MPPQSYLLKCYNEEFIKITAVKASISGKFSWAEWGLQKAISIAVSLVSAGWDAIARSCTAIKNTVKNVAKLGTELGKKGINVALKQVGLALGKGIAKECVTALVNYGVDKTLVADIEKHIAQDVSEKITKALANNQLVRQAIALDN